MGYRLTKKPSFEKDYGLKRQYPTPACVAEATTAWRRPVGKITVNREPANMSSYV